MRPFAAGTSREGDFRVLIVEDSAADADLVAAMLEDELPGVVITTARSVAEAAPLLIEQLDVAITDLSLPDAEGLEALAAVRATRPDLPVVVMTGQNDRETALAALGAGAEDYLVKGSHDARAVATAVLYAEQRRRAEAETRRYERLALSLLDAMEAATCAVDSVGEIVAVNRAWRDFAKANGGDPCLTGVGGSYFDACPSAIGVDAASAVAVEAGLREVLRGELARFELDYPCHGAGEGRWISLRVNPLLDGDGAVLSHVDISAAKRAEHELAHRTMHDALTALPNRDLLNDRLHQALAWAERSGLQVGVGFIDLDQFKRVNDSLGHQAGDELLRAVAQRLRGHLRSGDTLSRFAGDEFVVVWPGLSSAGEAEALADRLRTCLEEPFDILDASVLITASIGVTLGAPPQQPDDLLLAADAAMYDAKHHGRGRTRMYTDELRDGAEARLRTEVALREALARDEMVLHYQPVVDLQHGTVRAVEALVRWQHPSGLRMPDTFIPVAESSGLILPLGEWVLNEACRQAAQWGEEGVEVDVAVNFSVRQILQPGVVEMITTALHDARLNPARLLVEVTESAVMEDAELAEVALRQIAQLGASIAIDDFGTGYSSLLYLKRYPIHALKIDRSFVSGMGSNADDDAIVASVVSLARAVGGVCIAEGVETHAQWTALRSLGCHQAQGYLFSRPVPADELPSAMRSCAELLQVPMPRPPRPSARKATALPSVVERIRQLQTAGASLHTIAAALNRENAPNPHGLRWHSASIAQVLADSARDAVGS